MEHITVTRIKHAGRKIPIACHSTSPQKLVFCARMATNCIKTTVLQMINEVKYNSSYLFSKLIGFIFIKLKYFDQRPAK